MNMYVDGVLSDTTEPALCVCICIVQKLIEAYRTQTRAVTSPSRSSPE